MSNYLDIFPVGQPMVCLRQEDSAPLGVVADAFDAAGVPWRYVDTWREAVPPLDDAGGLVVLGGAMNVDEVESYPQLAELRRLVRDAVEADTPVLGICLGAQVLARALGAEVTRAPVRETGFVRVTATAAGAADPVVAPFAPAAWVFQFHQDACALPDGAELLLTGDDVHVQAFRLGSAYGVQFHFEVTEEIIAGWCDLTGAETLAAVWGTSKEQLLAEARERLPAQQAAARELVERFLSRAQ